METLWQDVRYGLRMLAKSPGFTAAVVLTLALGIGANTAIFGLVNVVLLKELPVKDPEQLARVRVYHKESIRDLSYPIFRDLSRLQQVLSGMTASGEFTPKRVSLGGSSQLQEFGRIQGNLVSANYFSMLGVTPVMGRMFTPEDSHTAGEGAVTVISFGFWERQFGRDPSVLGRTITLNRTPFTIIGVAPRGFFGDQVGMIPDFWVPILMQPRLEGGDQLERHTSTWFRTIARLKLGISKSQADAELTVLFQQLMAEEIASGSGSLISQDKPQDFRVELQVGSSGLNNLQSEFKRPLQLLMGIVGLVLLIACCNVANLLLARATARQKEIVVRLALGAGRVRLIRQLLTESVLLAVMGGTLGLLVAWWSNGLLLTLVPLSVDLHPDLRILAFTLAVSLLSVILFGFAPALQATSANISPALQASSRHHSSGRPKQRFSRALVISQVALSLCLLIGAGLLVRSLQKLRGQDIGLERDNVLMLDVFADETAIKRTLFPDLQGQLLERLKAVPGVRSVSFSAYRLFSGSFSTAPVRVPGSNINPEKDDKVRENWVSSEYFRTLGMRLLLGRTFTDQDARIEPKVAVINERMARHYFGQESPIGKTVYFPKVDARGRYIPFRSQLDRSLGLEVVGVVQDAKYDDLREATPSMAYLPISPVEGLPSSIEVRTVGQASGVALQVRQILNQVNPNIILRSIETLEGQIDETLLQERLFTKVLGFFGLLALGLACVGLYGIMSYAVVCRTNEIGVRLALGSEPSDVLRMVLRETMLLVLVGIAIGVPVALAATRLLSSLLFGLTPGDPATILLGMLVMATVALFAGYLPARKASRVDPMVALRYE
jgi:predicted permease